MQDPAQLFILKPAKGRRRERTDASGKTNEKINDDGQDQRSLPCRRQPVAAAKMPHDHTVYDAVQLLKNLGQKDRRCEQQQRPPDRPLFHMHFCLPVFKNIHNLLLRICFPLVILSIAYKKDYGYFHIFMSMI